MEEVKISADEITYEDNGSLAQFYTWYRTEFTERYLALPEAGEKV